MVKTNMNDCRMIRSLDNFSIEVYDLKGVTYVDIVRHGIRGEQNSIDFKKGEQEPAIAILKQIAGLLTR